MPTQLLLYVADCPELLKSRRSVLSRMWNVVCADSKSAWQLFCDNDFDLAVVCHSVPPTTYQRLASRIHQLSPSTPVLRVLLQGTSQVPRGENLVLDDPQTLTDAILRALGKGVAPLVLRKGA